MVRRRRVATQVAAAWAAEGSAWTSAGVCCMPGARYIDEVIEVIDPGTRSTRRRSPSAVRKFDTAAKRWPYRVSPLAANYQFGITWPVCRRHS